MTDTRQEQRRTKSGEYAHLEPLFTEL
ncbi:hypothetical protein B0I28_1051, partial [Glycomyces artemisiae]